MNLLLTKSDFLVTNSDYVVLLAKIKIKIKRLQLAMQHHIDDYLKKVIDADSKKDADNIKQNVYLDEHMELWVYDLKQQLIDLEFFWRAATLRIFLHCSNYLHVLRTPIKKSYDHRYKLPVYNIEFPKKEQTEPTLLLKDLSKLKRKKCASKISTCG